MFSWESINVSAVPSQQELSDEFWSCNFIHYTTPGKTLPRLYKIMTVMSRGCFINAAHVQKHVQRLTLHSYRLRPMERQYVTLTLSPSTISKVLVLLIKYQ